MIFATQSLCPSPSGAEGERVRRAVSVRLPLPVLQVVEPAVPAPPRDEHSQGKLPQERQDCAPGRCCDRPAFYHQVRPRDVISSALHFCRRQLLNLNSNNYGMHSPCKDDVESAIFVWEQDTMVCYEEVGLVGASDTLLSYISNTLPKRWQITLSLPRPFTV